MKTRTLARSVAMAILGVLAVSQSAVADVPPLDFPAACLTSLNGAVLDNEPQAPTTLWGGQAPLPVSAGSLEVQPVRVSLWRVGCGGAKAALQMRLGMWGDPYFIDARVAFPQLFALQNGREVEIGALRLSYPNSPQSPGPVATGDTWGSPGMYVLTTNGANVDLNAAMTLKVKNPSTGATALSVNLPGYTPTGPTALPLNGRLVGNFYDPNKSGEGVLVEIGDFAQNDVGPVRHYLQFNWFTYDNNGRPFWISGGGEFVEGDAHVHMPAIFRGGGRFAGGKAPTELTPWGTVDMEFTDCNTLRIGYNGNAGLPANVPSGSGQLEWHRLTGVSGYRCD